MSPTRFKAVQEIVTNNLVHIKKYSHSNLANNNSVNNSVTAAFSPSGASTHNTKIAKARIMADPELVTRSRSWRGYKSTGRARHATPVAKRGF